MEDYIIYYNEASETYGIVDSAFSDFATHEKNGPRWAALERGYKLWMASECPSHVLNMIDLSKNKNVSHILFNIIGDR